MNDSKTPREAGDGIRTHDNHVGNVVLYQLSYTRIFRFNLSSCHRSRRTAKKHCEKRNDVNPASIGTIGGAARSANVAWEYAIAFPCPSPFHQLQSIHWHFASIFSKRRIDFGRLLTKIGELLKKLYPTSSAAFNIPFFLETFG